MATQTDKNATISKEIETGPHWLTSIVETMLSEARKLIERVSSKVVNKIRKKPIEKIMSGGRRTELIGMNVRIEGKKAFGILDTGATASCCSPELAFRLGLEILPDHTAIMQVDTIT